ncbi:MAG: hypothetical protein ACRC5T_08190, partial [Cetobacterium sp.]
ETLSKIRCLRKQSSVISDMFVESEYSNTRNRRYPFFEISENGFHLLVSSIGKSKTKPNEVLTAKMGLKTVYIKKRFEYDFSILLKSVLEEFNVEVLEQFTVLKYRLDFYLPDFNLAIEYDEKNHRSEKSIKKDLEREKEIKEALGCEFLRCDFEDTDIKNAMKIIKNIFCLTKKARVI